MNAFKKGRIPKLNPANAGQALVLIIVIPLLCLLSGFFFNILILCGYGPPGPVPQVLAGWFPQAVDAAETAQRGARSGSYT